MDNPGKLATRRGNQEWTIQRNWQHEGVIKNGQSRETGCCLVDIGVFVDHHILNFLFIIFTLFDFVFV
jgi:hypothetical protein